MKNLWQIGLEATDRQVHGDYYLTYYLKSMLGKVFFLALRSIGIPYAAVYLLSRTALGEEGALIAVGLALLIVNIIGIGLSALKILSNTIMLKPIEVLYHIGSIFVQAGSVIFIWIYYFSNYQ